METGNELFTLDDGGELSQVNTSGEIDALPTGDEPNAGFLSSTVTSREAAPGTPGTQPLSPVFSSQPIQVQHGQELAQAAAIDVSPPGVRGDDATWPKEVRAAKAMAESTRCIEHAPAGPKCKRQRIAGARDLYVPRESGGGDDTDGNDELIIGTPVVVKGGYPAQRIGEEAQVVEFKLGDEYRVRYRDGNDNWYLRIHLSST